MLFFFFKSVTRNADFFKASCLTSIRVTCQCTRKMCFQLVDHVPIYHFFNAQRTTHNAQRTMQNAKCKLLSEHLGAWTSSRSRLIKKRKIAIIAKAVSHRKFIAKTIFCSIAIDVLHRQ